MTIPTITTGTLAAGYALDAASVTTATSAASISVPVGSLLLIAAATQNANPGGASVGTPTFNGNAMTAQVSSPAGSVTHGDWNGGGFWSWQNSGGSTVTGTITVPATGGTPQRLRMRAWIISGHSTSTPFQTVTSANLVNTSNGAADPALMPASGTLTAQVDGVLFLLGLDFASALATSTLGSVSDEYEMLQADSNYWISGYSVAAATGVSGSWTRGNTNGYKLFGLVLNPAVAGTPPTPSTPTISGVSATSTTATATLTLATEGRSSVSVRYGTDGTTWTTITGTANQTSFSITGLTANTVYLLQARATNSAATVPDSAWSSSTTFGTENPVTGTADLASITAPAFAPTGLSTTDITASTATLNCSVLSGATSYDWQYGTSSGSYGSVVNTSTNTYPLLLLSAYTFYYWQVRARNSAGAGPWSTEQTFRTSGATLNIIFSGGRGVASEVDICNVALAHIGDTATVASISPPEGSAQASHCARFYPIARDSILELHSWGFATKRVALAQLTNNWPEWQYCYAVPQDSINLLAVLGPASADDYSVPINYLYSQTGNTVAQAGGVYQPQPYNWETLDDGTQVIYTNQADATLRYSAYIIDSTVFSPLFVEALSWYLASMLAGPVIKGEAGAAEAKRCLAMATGVLSKATTSDANQRRTVISQNVPWMTGR